MALNPYRKPHEVTSPKDRWTLVRVIRAGKEDDYALAIGVFDDGEKVAKRLAIRWNGRDDVNPLGHPQIRGKAVWFILPEDWHDVALEFADGDPKDKDIARALLESA